MISPVSHNGTRYVGVYLLTNSTISEWIANHGFAIRIGTNVYGGDVRSIKVLARDLGLSAIRITQNNLL